MWFDYTIVVRGKKRKPAEIRALAAQLGTLVEQDADAELGADDDLELVFDGVGNFDMRRLKRGYVLSVDSNRGNRDGWDEICGIVDKLGRLLGTLVEDPDAIDKMHAESTPPRAENADIAVMTLEDREGAVIETARVYIEHFAQFVDPGGMPSLPHALRPAMVSEDYRYGKGAAIMRGVMHDSTGVAFRRFVWTLDGYGRIRGVVVSEL
jgi:hypothetical protein